MYKFKEKVSTVVPVLSVRRTVYWPMSFSRTVPIVSLCSRADELLSWWSALSALIVCDSCVHSTVDKNKNKVSTTLLLTLINVALRLHAEGDLVAGGGGGRPGKGDHGGALRLGGGQAHQNGAAAEALAGVVEGLAGVDAGVLGEDLGNVEDVVVALDAAGKVRRRLDLLVVVQPDDVKARFAWK
ncbi:hypothetical protein TYRP_018093 [Tyrophagus putrescentiae]|nr:hypothetical protein TYRP_018093 [Tyrophagus putrescentiae]